MNIRFPTQSLILAGESSEIDGLVRRATRIEGGIGPLVAVSDDPDLNNPQTDSRALAVSEIEVTPRAVGSDGNSIPSRPRTPIDLYRWVDQPTQRYARAQSLDLFA